MSHSISTLDPDYSHDTLSMNAQKYAIACSQDFDDDAPIRSRITGLAFQGIGTSICGFVGLRSILDILGFHFQNIVYYASLHRRRYRDDRHASGS